MYISIVAETAMLPHFLTLSEKWLATKNSLMIFSKITLIESSDGSGTFKIWKYLMNLGVSGDLPPPGGAAAHNIINFSIIFQ